MSFQDDRRGEQRSPANARGVVVAPGLEVTCRITDASAHGLRLRLDRNLALPPSVIVVDIAAGLAYEGDVAWRKGLEAGLKVRAEARLRGLIPSRLTAARDAWLRAGGR
jgi:hypothetical protein